MYQDITLKCRDCGNEFIFSAGEQEFYAEKGLQNRPQRCKACRDARKAAAAEGGNGGRKEFFVTTCARCGGEAKLPFQPSNTRPVLQQLLRGYPSGRERSACIGTRV